MVDKTESIKGWVKLTIFFKALIFLFENQYLNLPLLRKVNFACAVFGKER